MPELPEVETIRRMVATHLVGRRCVAVNLTLPKLLRDSPIPDLSAMVGRTVLEARRRAKVLIVGLSDGLVLMVHFKLAGQLAIIRPDGQRAVAGHPVPKPDGEYPHPATHVTFSFDDQSTAYYSDVRQFGWLRLLPVSDVEQAIGAFGYGPEATTGGFTASYLAERLGRRIVPVKTALLNQSVLAGLGNIYVDEALFAASVDPRRSAASLSTEEIVRLSETIPAALTEGIKQGGATIIHRRAYPIDGFPAVHGRAGEACITCGRAITKIRVGARGTYLCEHCQR